MTRRHSAFSLAAQALRGHRDWPSAWRHAEPKPSYDIVVIGGGGHGLATAYYLAKNHGVRNVAVIEKGWIGGGNTGRNTAAIRSNYLYPESARLYDFSLRLYEKLSAELDFNIMFSQRGVLTLAHSRHDIDSMSRWINAMLLNGVDSELVDRAQVLAMAPELNVMPGARYEIHGGLLQRRGGIARHDAVAWGYARAASALGVDIVENCAVTGFEIENGAVRGVRTSRGTIRSDRVGIAVAGSSSVLASMVGVRLPVVSCALQAMVTEPVKPVLDTVLMSPAVGTYWSQSDKGEIVIGGGIDRYQSYAQRGGLPMTQQVCAATVEMFPSFSRLRLMRQWAGIVDLVPDSSPIIDELPVGGLAINCGWGTGGFKAIPVGGWVFAHLLATRRAHELGEPFGLERFRTGRLIDEAAASGILH